MEEALDSIEDALDKVLEIPIWIFLEMILVFTGLDIAEVEEKMFEFAISLWDTTIQDGGIRERNNDFLLLFFSSFIFKNNIYYFI